MSSNLFLKDGIVEKTINKKNLYKKRNSKKNGAKIWHEKTQWVWNLKNKLPQTKKKLQLKELGSNLKD
jgi:hypothetical protein